MSDQKAPDTRLGTDRVGGTLRKYSDWLMGIGVLGLLAALAVKIAADFSGLNDVAARFGDSVVLVDAHFAGAGIGLLAGIVRVVIDRVEFAVPGGIVVGERTQRAPENRTMRQ